LEKSSVAQILAGLDRQHALAADGNDQSQPSHTVRSAIAISSSCSSVDVEKRASDASR
jgi:hypothetical protein